MESCLPLLKTPARTGRLFMMWCKNAECVTQRSETEQKIEIVAPSHHLLSDTVVIFDFLSARLPIGGGRLLLATGFQAAIPASPMSGEAVASRGSRVDWSGWW